MASLMSLLTKTWFGAKNISDKPWRNIRCPAGCDFWSDQHLRALKRDVPMISFMSEKNVTKGKIVVIGPVQSGKSSFINSILGVDKDRLVQKTQEGGGQQSMTLQHHQFVCKNFLVCDTRGLEIGDLHGFNVDDIVCLLKGNIPRDHKFDERYPITAESPGYNPTPSNDDRVHCVIFCIDCSTLQTQVHPEYKRKMQKLQDELKALKVPRIMLLTKIDTYCEDVNKDLTLTFRSKKIQEAVKRASEMFMLPPMYIHPVKNFKDETYPETNQSILLLLAMKSALEFAQDCVEELDTENSQAAAQGPR